MTSGSTPPVGAHFDPPGTQCCTPGYCEYRPAMAAIKPNEPHMARIYDYLLGGVNNFAVDREQAERVCAAMPGGIEGARANIRANRVFLVQAVRHLAGELGLRQFLDIGTGIPNADGVHAVAQQTAPDARVVYVDHDPVVLAHAHQLLKSTQDGATDFVQADLRNPTEILDAAAKTLDFTKPVVAMLVGVLHYLDDTDDPHGVVAQLIDAVPSGSYVVVSHLASDVHVTELSEMAELHNEEAPDREKVVLRSRDEIGRLFTGLDLLPPGVARLDELLAPGTTPPRPDAAGPHIPMYGAVARKQ